MAAAFTPGLGLARQLYAGVVRPLLEEISPGLALLGGPGSAVITARLARDLMRLCLLMDRRYPPYSKWLGTAFEAPIG